LSDCAFKEAKAIYDIAAGVQAGINELSDAGKELAAADMRSAFVFISTHPGTTFGNNVLVEGQPQSVPPPAVTFDVCVRLLLQYLLQSCLTFDAFRGRGNDFGGGGQPSYGSFGGGAVRQSKQIQIDCTRKLQFLFKYLATVALQDALFLGLISENTYVDSISQKCKVLQTLHQDITHFDRRKRPPGVVVLSHWGAEEEA
jgi:hypothetical protein